VSLRRLRTAVLACQRTADSMVKAAAVSAVGTATAAVGNTASAVGSATAAAQTALAVAAQAAAAGRQAAGASTAAASKLAAAGGETAGKLAGAGADAFTKIADLGPRRHQRRVWSQRGHAAIEVKGLSGRASKRLADEVRRGLRGVNGVRWAEVNAVTAQVLVAFDERRVDVGTLLGAVETVERKQGVTEEDFSWSRPEHPSDDTAFAATCAALAADLVGLGAGVAGRAARIPPLHPVARVPLALMESYPRLRGELEKRIGPVATDVLLGAGNAALYGLAEGPARPANGVFYRLLLIGELQARGQVWSERGQDLCFATPHAAACESPAPAGEPAPERPPPERPAQDRPAPLPDGPIEKWTDRSALAAFLTGSSVLAATRDPGRAADALLAGVPRAARLGREGFAAVLGRDLARRGVIPMDRGALRRLDRLSTVVIDSSVLCSSRLRVLSATGGDQAGNGQGGQTALWRAAGGVLRRLSAGDLSGPGPWGEDGYRLEREGDSDAAPADPAGARLAVVTAAGEKVGQVTVGCELDELAEAILAAARSTGGKVLLSRHASTQDLVGLADEVIDGSLVSRIRELQAAGEGVLVLSLDGAALAAADVSVGCLREGAPVCWPADLICGPGLADVWRLLHAASRAGTVSDRSVTLSVGGCALGVLLAAVGRRRRTIDLTVSPTQAATFASVAMGAYTARSATRQSPPRPVPRTAWHAMEPMDVLGRLASGNGHPGGGGRDGQRDGQDSHGGLPLPGQLRRVTGQFGASPAGAVLLAPVRQVTGLAEAVVGELKDPLTPVLVVGAAASAVLGSGVDSALVGGVMVGNAVIGGLQRMRTERALQDLLLREQQAGRRVTRSPQDPLPERPDDPAMPTEIVAASDLRPGDVIALRPDDVVPADARIIAAEALEVDEATLTGESLPVSKDAEPTVALNIAERTSMLYEGTTVLAGAALAVVVAVGDATEAGRASMAAGAAKPAAGVQARLGDLTRIALPATGLGGLAVTGLSLLRRTPLRQAVASGVAVAVAAVPEGLPLVATVAQLAAARRLSARGVLVRSARTLEALGRVDVLCFDKTGTLTEGRLEVARVTGADAGAEPDSERGKHLLRVAGRACPVPGQQRITHATDRAILEASEPVGNGDGWELLEELPFQGGRGFSASLGRDQGQLSLAVKGAPEVLLGKCSHVLAASEGSGTERVPLDDGRRRAAQSTVERLAADGLRVLAIAEREPPADAGQADGDGGQPPAADLVEDLTLAGFVAIADVMRPEAANVVAELAGAGVRAVMITGDHPATASAIARKAGIKDADQVVTGAELDGLAEVARRERVSQATVFARVSPEQKVRIVTDLRRQGHVVAMTGDGTNDAAAIRTADVGIGVAARGSTAARSASDLVLPGSEIGRLADALREGRTLWRSVREAVSILVGGNAGEVTFMVLGTALSGRSPLNTRQLLLVNMLTDMFPALAVALGPRTPEQAGNGSPAHLLGAPLARAIAVRGAATTLGATMAWAGGRATGRGARASTMGLAALVLTQLNQTLLANARSPVVIVTCAASAGALVLIVNTPGVSQFFGCTPLGPVGWGMVAGSSALATAAGAVAPRFIPHSDPQKEDT
jgi:cation-transporting P-type ATPase I